MTRADPGLCARCVHACVQTNPRGSRFWRCRLADSDDRLLRYPPLPVLRCGGFQEGQPTRAVGSPGPSGTLGAPRKGER